MSILRRTTLFPALCLILCAQAAESSAHAVACSAMKSLKLTDATVLTADSVPAGSFAAPNGKSYPVNAFCRVTAVAHPTADSDIHFELWLPQSGWNGRYYQHGEGGGGGFINYATLAALMNEGAVSAASDNGHRQDARQSYDFGYDHPEKIIDFGYRALQVTRDHAERLIAGHYGKAAKRYYFTGCSGGGAEAMMAAQRFPERWDGILAGAPDEDALGFFASTAWQAHQWLTRPAGRIPPAQLPLIEAAALASCKPEAHVDNGFAADPRQCPFDPQVLSCQRAGQTDCLSAEQIETLRNIYAGPPPRTDGRAIYSGFPPTRESGWSRGITGGLPSLVGHTYDEREPLAMHFAMKFFRAFVFDDPNWHLHALELPRDHERALSKQVGGVTLARAQNANDPDLSALQRRGGKLILYTGWGDPFISALDIIAYYDAMANTMGSSARDQFSRLFAVPGMGHCTGGVGAYAFGQTPQLPMSTAVSNDAEHDVRRALEAWVEQDKAPDRLVAARYVDDRPEQGVAFTRPLCPYPKIPVYRGTGSRDLAENFRCQP